MIYLWIIIFSMLVMVFVDWYRHKKDPLNFNNFYHKGFEFFPFTDRINQTNYILSIYFNVLDKFVLGGNINLSSWYLELTLNIICINIQIHIILNKKRIQE